jgi:HPt (histidine-containing phosphotransfer) domain-containing protein
MTPDTLLAHDTQRFQGIAHPLEASLDLRCETVAPPIDANILLAHCMGNVSLAVTLLGELEANGKQQVDAIGRQVANDDPYAAAEAAHALKGAAAIIGAEPLRGKAAEIEAAGRDGE